MKNAIVLQRTQKQNLKSDHESRTETLYVIFNIQQLVRRYFVYLVYVSRGFLLFFSIFFLILLYFIFESDSSSFGSWWGFLLVLGFDWENAAGRKTSLHFTSGYFRFSNSTMLILQTMCVCVCMHAYSLYVCMLYRAISVSDFYSFFLQLIVGNLQQFA